MTITIESLAIAAAVFGIGLVVACIAVARMITWLR
jgi:hypothetical protein